MREIALRVGDEATLTRLIRDDDIRTFAGITGDENPVHLDADYARQTRFGRPIAHGLLVAGLISAALGMKLPGPGCIYMSQSLSFLAPVYPGDTVTALVSVTAVDPTRQIVVLHTEVANQAGVKVISGEARLLCWGAWD